MAFFIAYMMTPLADDDDDLSILFLGAQQVQAARDLLTDELEHDISGFCLVLTPRISMVIYPDIPMTTCAATLNSSTTQNP